MVALWHHMPYAGTSLEQGGVGDAKWAGGPNTPDKSVRREAPEACPRETERGSMANKHQSAMEVTGRGRITARLSAEKQELLQLAADLSGSTLNQFVVQSALRAAEQVIEHEEAIKAIKLTVEQSRRFVALLDEPAKPNDALRRAMERFRKTKVGTSDSTFELERRPHHV